MPRTYEELAAQQISARRWRAARNLAGLSVLALAIVALVGWGGWQGARAAWQAFRPAAPAVQAEGVALAPLRFDRCDGRGPLKRPTRVPCAAR